MPRCRRRTNKSPKSEPAEQLDVFDNELENAGQRPRFTCHFCNKSYSLQGNLRRHVKTLHKSEVSSQKRERSSSTSSDRGDEERYVVSDDELLYQCNECDERFAQLKALEQHAYSHVRKKPYKCSKCVRAFSTIRELETHVKRHSLLKPLKCPMCSYATAYSSYLKQHIKFGHRSDKPFRCSNCRKNFRTLNDLKFHMIFHGEKPYLCPHCEKAFDSFNTLRHHVQIHKPMRRFACSQCGVRFNYVTYLHKHMMLKHDDAGTHKCSICDKSFHLEKVLKLHLAWHNMKSKKEMEQQIYTCLSCDKAFKKQKLIEKHVKSCIVVDEGVQLTCTLCNRLFVNTIVYKKHMAKHSGEQTQVQSKSFGCSKCSKKFETKSKAYTHLMSHDPMLYKCGLCCRTFRDLGYFDLHLKNHPIGVLCICAICCEEFTQLPDLAEHVLSHPGEFKCDHCEESFLSLRDQRKHMRIHSTSNLFNCMVCFAAFTCRVTLMEHWATHKDREPSSEAIACVEEPETEQQTSEVRSVKIGARKNLPRAVFQSPSFTCEKCDKTFKKKESLDKHVASCLIVDERVELPCTQCQRVFNNSMVFKEHVAKHSVESSASSAFVCKQCNMSFPTKLGINAHLLNHDPRVFGCSLCLKYFKTPKSVTSHMQLHPGAGMYKCANCEEMFRTFTEIDNHIFSHSGIFKCEKCTDSFVTLRHQRMHTFREHKTKLLCETMK